MIEGGDTPHVERERKQMSTGNEKAIYSVSRIDQAARAVEKTRVANKSWAERRKALSQSMLEKSSQAKSSHDTVSKSTSLWRRETFRLPRDEAREQAKQFFLKYPKAAYWSEIENWRVLEEGMIEFTMRRLPTAD